MFMTLTRSSQPVCILAWTSAGWSLWRLQLLCCPNTDWSCLLTSRLFCPNLSDSWTHGYHWWHWKHQALEFLYISLCCDKGNWKLSESKESHKCEENSDKSGLGKPWREASWACMSDNKNYHWRLQKLQPCTKAMATLYKNTPTRTSASNNLSNLGLTSLLLLIFVARENY